MKAGARLTWLTVICFGVTVSLAGQGEWRTLPPEEPIPALEVRGREWTQQGCIVQPWGKSQWDIMHGEIGDLPERLKRKFGFNAIIMVPPETLKYHTGPQHVLTEKEFARSLEAYRRAGYRIIMYTSITNCGHGPVWQEGQLSREHPEWSQIDAAGNTRNIYHNPWLCPNTGALDFTIDYTKGLVKRYRPDAVMLDNNQFMWGENGASPTCYCDSCQGKFKEYVKQRFGSEAKRFFGVKAEEVRIPTEAGDLYNLWIHWRSRSMAAAVERFRRRLVEETQAKPVLFANTQYMWQDWSLATDEQFQHEDMVLSESRFLDSIWMSAKMVVGKALAQGRPLWNYLGTFDEKDFTLLKPPGEVGRLTAATMMHLSNPWLVYYGFDQHDEKNGPSRKVLGDLFFLRAEHPELFNGLEHWGSIGSVISVRSFNYQKTTMIPSHLEKLRKAGIASKGICDLYLDSKELAQYKVVVAEKVSSLSTAGVKVLSDWISAGGVLISTSDLGDCDEIGRKRPFSISEQLKADKGKGQLVIAKNNDDILREVKENAAEKFAAVESENTAGRFIEVRPYKSANGKLILHVVNHGEEVKGGWKLRLPGKFVGRGSRGRIYIPGRSVAMEIKVSGKNGAGTILGMPGIDAYAIVELDSIS